MSIEDDLLNSKFYINPYRNEPDHKCDHGVYFDINAARRMEARQVRHAFPRLNGACPKGCGYVGIAYASAEHYIYGDW